MDGQQRQGDFVIKATAQAVGEQYSDISMTGLFNAYVSLINSERQVMWTRYNIMLVANSIIFAFIANRKDIGLHELVFICIFGSLLCVAWFVLTWCGWNIFSTWNDEAEKFSWSMEGSGTLINPNPIRAVEKHGNDKKMIKRATFFVIVLFFAGYVAFFFFLKT